MFAALSVFVLLFLDSGSDRGVITLLHPESYPPGTVTHVPEHGLFVVNLGAGLLVLSDDDPASGLPEGRRCRVRAHDAGEPGAAALVASYSARISPGAEGAETVLVGDCGGAVYDVTGVRLDGDGPNLDRLESSVDEAGRVSVNSRARTCTRRRAAEFELPALCVDR